MSETLPQIRPSFNRSLRLETRPEWLSADTGALVQREMMDRSGLIDWLTERLHDPRDPSSIRYPLSDLLRTRLLLLGQGWRDQSDADRLPQDPSLRVASCAETGDLIDGELFPGASHLGKRALKLTLRVVDRCRGRLRGSMIVRMDAGFPEPGLLQGLESRGVPYIARIRKNEVLNRMAKPYLTQPAGRPPEAPPRLWFHELSYQAGTWDRARRVVLVVRERPGELYPDHFWLLTSLSRKRYEAEALLARYRKRGKAEGHMGELMDVLDPALSSASRLKTHYRGKSLKSEARSEARTEAGVRSHNEVRFLLNLLAYEILHLGRVIMEQATRRGWSLRRFHERVLRVASRVLRQGRSIFVISQGATDWKRLWKRLARVSWAPG